MTNRDVKEFLPCSAYMDGDRLVVIVNVREAIYDSHKDIASVYCSIRDEKGSTPATFWPEISYVADGGLTYKCVRTPDGKMTRTKVLLAEGEDSPYVG